jgi:hypothetical protein
VTTVARAEACNPAVRIDNHVLQICALDDVGPFCRFDCLGQQLFNASFANRLRQRVRLKTSFAQRTDAAATDMHYFL